MGGTHHFSPRHMERLISPERRKMLDPAKALGCLNLRPGMVLADLGAGPGFFTLDAARMVAPGGKVLAIDISREMLELCMQRAGEEGIKNVEPVLATGPHRYPVATASVDAVLMAVVLHEADSPAEMLGEVRRMLKPGGAVLLAEWKKEEMPMGPPLAHRLSPEEVTEEFAVAGFVQGEACEIGPYHYALRFDSRPHD